MEELSISSLAFDPALFHARKCSRNNSLLKNQQENTLFFLAHLRGYRSEQSGSSCQRIKQCYTRWQLLLFSDNTAELQAGLCKFRRQCCPVGIAFASCSVIHIASFTFSRSHKFNWSSCCPVTQRYYTRGSQARCPQASRLVNKVALDDLTIRRFDPRSSQWRFPGSPLTSQLLQKSSIMASRAETIQQNHEPRPDPQSLTSNPDPSQNSSTGVDYEPHPDQSIKVSPEREKIVQSITSLYSGSASEEDIQVYAKEAVYDDPWSYCDTRYKIAGQWYGK